uniref:Putative secreted protein n=1 Tax=Ixodes ricinus TaxID=34613 RepID=A0A147BAJ7_IXORI
MASFFVFFLIRCSLSTRIRVCLVPLVCYSMREKNEPILGTANLYKDISFCFSASSSSCVASFSMKYCPANTSWRKKGRVAGPFYVT